MHRQFVLLISQFLFCLGSECSRKIWHCAFPGTTHQLSNILTWAVLLRRNSSVLPGTSVESFAPAPLLIALRSTLLPLETLGASVSSPPLVLDACSSGQLLFTLSE